MSIISKNKDISNYNHTYLKITSYNDLSREFGNVVPYPTKHIVNDTNFVYFWLIDGFFHTNKSTEFINDIKSRFLISFKNHQ